MEEGRFVDIAGLRVTVRRSGDLVFADFCVGRDVETLEYGDEDDRQFIEEVVRMLAEPLGLRLIQYQEGGE